MPKNIYIGPDGKKNIEDVDMEMIQGKKFIYGGQNLPEAPLTPEEERKKKMKFEPDA